MDADVLPRSDSLDLRTWTKFAATIASILLALIFLSSGIWKITDPFKWSQFLGDFRVPSSLAMPFTLSLGIGETFAAVLILVPRFRRWGAVLVGLLLLAFMIYIGANYSALVGKECSCFPIVKRTIGPGFFIGDGVMLVLAVLAGMWSRRSDNVKVAMMILGAVAVFAGVSYGMNAARMTGIKAPDSITVDGKPLSLQSGHVFVFFYDPMCMHCDAAARRMSKLNWKDTNVVSIPIDQPQFAASFLHDTGLKAGTSLDVKPMRDLFSFVNAPYGVALVDGRQKAAIGTWDDAEPAKTLRQIGFVD
jgi:uncharacterized membrane protein YphA (DoxX/SURF4 family)